MAVAILRTCVSPRQLHPATPVWHSSIGGKRYQAGRPQERLRGVDIVSAQCRREIAPRATGPYLYDIDISHTNAEQPDRHALFLGNRYELLEPEEPQVTYLHILQIPFVQGRNQVPEGALGVT